MERVLRPRWLKPLILLICLLGSVQSTLATTVIIPSDDEMIIEARAIVRGRVLSIGSSFDNQNNRIYTYITLRVQEVIKGEISARKIVIKEEGGQVGLRGSRIFGTPEFTPNENVLLYLDTWADGSLRVHQLFLGKFSIVEDPDTGKLTVVRSAPDANVVVLNNDLRRDQATSTATERMELSAYTEMVRSKLAANLERSQEFEKRYYQDVAVLAKPPEYAGKAKRGDIEPRYVFLSPSSPPRWFEIDSGQPVTFLVNSAGAPSSQIVADVNAAMNAWSTIPNCALRVANGGSTDGCGPDTATNTIIFNGCDGRWAPSSCSGVLALGGCSWYGGITEVVNGTTFYKAVDGFVSMNPYASCYFTNQDCNIQEVTTHELGHALGLGHSLDSTATMYAIAHFDGRCASTRTDDQAGMVFIYPASGGGPGPLTVVTSSLLGGTVGTAYNQSLSASGGTSPYNWSLVAGQGTLPTGLSLSAGGVISGTPSAAGTFNFTVNVTDSASPAGSAQKALSIVVSATGGLPLDSQFVSQSVPASVQPGQSFNVNLKFLNTGTQAWTGSPFYVVSQNPPLNQTWGGNALSLGSVTNPGQTLDVPFTVTAPSTAGTYNFQWQMYKNDGTGFFGQMSTNVVITVGTQPAYDGYHDSADCQAISGWAWDSNQPSSSINVDIYDGATLIATVAANVFRQDLLSAGKGNGVHGFSFATPASLKNGQPHSIRVKFSGTNTDLPGTGKTITCGGSYLGYHDWAECQSIGGWAWDSNQPNSAINVDIYDGATLIATVSANLFRQDLLNAGIGNGSHAFSFATPASLKNGQPHSIRVKFSGTSTDLFTTPKTITCGGNYQGYEDWAYCQLIGGWAWDSNQPNSPINVDIYDGTTLIATVAANQFRQDLLNAGMGNGNHAFSFATPASLKDGQPHSIRVKFSGTSTDFATPKTITCGASYQGYQDWAGCQSIGGWAWDSNQPNNPINVDIYDGTTLIATVTANLFRQDLLNAGIGNGSHAFSFATPASLKDGAVHIIHFTFGGTSTELPGSPKSITCFSP